MAASRAEYGRQQEGQTHRSQDISIKGDVTVDQRAPRGGFWGTESFKACLSTVGSSHLAGSTGGHLWSHCVLHGTPPACVPGASGRSLQGSCSSIQTHRGFPPLHRPRGVIKE